jgi:membrane-associated phospholipid phosphatase
MNVSTVKDKTIKGVSHFFEEIKNFLWGIGYFGWQIAFLYGLYVSFNYKITYGLLFLILFLTSGFINENIFKKFIYNLRPLNSTKFLHSEVFRKKTNGMPSGHAQQTAFALTYTYLLTHKYFYESITLFLITVTQRYIFKNHTMPQLIVGSVCGIILGALAFYITNLVNARSNSNTNKSEQTVEKL